MEGGPWTGNPLDPSFTHWGEAAFYFSLDMSEDLYGLLFSSRPLQATMRDACRRAILQNRERQSSPGSPLHLRALIEQIVGRSADIGHFVTFVEQSLVTMSRPQNRDFPFFVVLVDDDLNERMSALLPSSMSQASLREHFYKALDGDLYAELFAAAIAIESFMRTGSMSDWDRDIIERNRVFYSRKNPLQNLVHSIDLDYRRAGFRSVLSQADPSAVAEMEKMC